jgi:tetratricopeptide (TPR) repeat protein
VILNKTTINQRLFNQKGLDENMLLEFKELIAVYPYASIFAIVYLEGLKHSGDIHFEGELLKHAFKISNRQVLHQLLSQEQAPVEEEEEEVFENIPIDTAIEIEEEQPLIIETEEEVIENIPIDTAIEIEEEQPLIVETEKVETITDELETLIKSSVANTVFIKEFNEDGEKLKIAAEEAATSDPAVEQKTTKTETSTFDVNPKSFNNWLKMADGKENTEKEERTSTMIPIEKQKRDFYSPIKKAKESIDENKMPVSETLAKIFILQGNYPKAIYVYEQLILLYPEKKNIFASQIKHLSIKLIN